MPQTQRLPLAQILAPRDAFFFTAKDSLLKNCYREKGPLGEMIVKRPGLVVNTQYPAGIGQAAIFYNGTPLFVIGDSIAGASETITGISWTAKTTTPKPTGPGGSATAKSGSLVSFNGDLYSIGGRDNLDTTISVYKSINNGTSWTTISTPWTTTTQNITQAACVLNSKIYAFGLVGGRRVYSSSDGVTWTLETTDLSGGGSHSINGVIVYQNVMYALLTNASATTQIWSSSNGSSWTAVNASITGTSQLNQTSFVEADGKFYIIGGQLSSSSVVATVYRSVDLGVNWTLLTSSANFGAREGAAVWYADGKIWLGGGSTTQADLTPTSDVYYSLDGISWTLATNAPGWTARVIPAYTVHDGTMYIGTGSTSSGKALGTYSANITQPGALPVPPPIPDTPFQTTLIPATTASPVKVFLKNNDIAYLYDGTTVTHISDPDYPVSTVYGVVYLDGTVYVMNAYGQIFGSDLAAPTSWSALNAIVANAEADAALAIARQLNYIVAFKEYTMEFFYNAGNPTGSPLSKVLNAVLAMGLASVGSLAQADNTIYFMATTRQYGRTVQRLDGYTPKYISNPFIDRILNADDLEEVSSFVVKSNGHYFYALSLGNITFVYDETTEDWHLWSGMFPFPSVDVTSAAVLDDGSIRITVSGGAHTRTDGSPVDISGMQPSQANGRFNLRYDPETMATNQFSYFPSTSVTSEELQYAGADVIFFFEDNFPALIYCKSVEGDLLLGPDNGTVYQFDTLTYTDDGNPINVVIQTALLDFGLMASKRYSRFELVGDKVDTNVYVRYSDDDYDNWSLYRQINMNTRRAKISNLGSGRRRGFSIKHTDDQPLRLLAAEIDFDQGAF